MRISNLNLHLKWESCVYSSLVLIHSRHPFMTSWKEWLINCGTSIKGVLNKRKITYDTRNSLRIQSLDQGCKTKYLFKLSQCSKIKNRVSFLSQKSLFLICVMPLLGYKNTTCRWYFCTITIATANFGWSVIRVLWITLN
jgi:hypothetical protein